MDAAEYLTKKNLSHENKHSKVMAKCWFNDLEVSESVIFAFLDFGYTTWKKLLQLQISHLYTGNKKEGCWGNRGLLGCVGHWVWCPEPCQKLISARKLMAPLLLGAASYRFLQDPTEQVPRKESVTEDRSRRRESWQPWDPLQFWLSRHMSSSEDFIFPRIASLKKTVFCLMSEQFRLSNQM